MRKIIVVLIVAVCAFGMISRVNAGSYQGVGNYVGTPSPSVTALFNAFPAGGEGLVNAIRELLLANPGLADDVAFVASHSSDAQQRAAAEGMAEAVIILLARGDTTGGGLIITAANLSGSAVLASAVTGAAGESNGALGLYLSTANGNPATLNCTTVSPTGPGSSC